MALERPGDLAHVLIHVNVVPIPEILTLIILTHTTAKGKNSLPFLTICLIVLVMNLTSNVK